MQSARPLRVTRRPRRAGAMDDRDDGSDLLRLGILSVLATRETPMTAREIADELARLALEGQRIALGGTRERGH